MAYEFKLPELGEGIESGIVVSVYVSEGDEIGKDDSVIELEMSKATVDVPSPVAGKVTKVLVSEDDEVSVGQVIVVIEESEQEASTETETEAEQADEAGKKSEAAEKEESQESASSSQEEESQAPSPSSTGSGGRHEFKLPELGEGIESGVVVSVYVSEGDEIGKDDSVIELEMSKATVDIPAPVAGKVLEVNVSEGDEVTVGQVIAVIESSGEVETKDRGEGPSDEKKEASSSPLRGAGVPEEKEEKEPSHTPSPSAQRYQPLDTVPDLDRIPAGPAARKLARELGLDLRKVKGSRRGGRIAVEDIKQYVKEFQQAGMRGRAKTEALPLPDFSKFGPTRREPLSNIRKVISERMAHAWATIPHVYQFDEIDVSAINSFHKKHSKDFKERGSTASVTTFIIKGLAQCLAEFPQFNASLDEKTQELIYKDYFNIGVAVDTPAGLLVPVMRSVDEMTIFEIGRELRELAGQARDRKLKPDQMTGGCITLSNLGGIGGTYFTPIINPPEVAILGVGRSYQKPVWEDGEWVPKTCFTACLSYDHRVIDGADGARFVVRLGEILNNFEKFLLGG